MLIEIIRFIIGSIKLFLTLAVLILGCIIVYHDVFKGANVSSSAYIFLSTILGTVAVYNAVEATKRSDPQAFKKIADFVRGFKGE